MTMTMRSIVIVIAGLIAGLGGGEAWAAPQGPGSFGTCHDFQNCAPSDPDPQPEPEPEPEPEPDPDPDPEPDPEPEPEDDPEPEPEDDPGAESSGYGDDVIVTQPRFTG